MKASVIRERDQKVLYEAKSVREAEAFVAGMEVFAPDQVHEGDFGIDFDDEAYEAWVKEK